MEFITCLADISTELQARIIYTDVGKKQKQTNTYTLAPLQNKQISKVLVNSIMVLFILCGFVYTVPQWSSLFPTRYLRTYTCTKHCQYYHQNMYLLLFKYVLFTLPCFNLECYLVLSLFFTLKGIPQKANTKEYLLYP